MNIGRQVEDSSSSSSSTAGTRVDALDGLRAIAILLVLLWHLTPNHNSNQGLRSIVFKLADLGWSGVDLFFVLSGFLITGILLRAKASNRPLRHFLMRRILRILPAYYLALFLVFLFIPCLLDLYPIADMSAQGPYWFYVSNTVDNKLPPGLGDFFNIGHFWSLAVEMQFYVLWSFVIYRFASGVVWRIGLAALVLGATGRIIAVVMNVDPGVTFTWLPFRADGLIVGSLIAVALHAGVRYEQVRSPLLLTVVVGSVFAMLIAWFDMADAPVFRGGDAPPTFLILRVITPSALSLLYGAGLWVSLQRNRLSAFLGCPLFKRLALYSYGIYIVHFLLKPVFDKSFGPKILAQWIGGQDAPIYLYFVLASSISFILAMASYHLFEIHFLRLKSNFSISAKPIGSLSTSIVQRPPSAISREVASRARAGHA